MTRLEQAFNAFKSAPTAENAWKLQQEMVAYGSSLTVIETKQPTAKKAKKSAKPKTSKGKLWDNKLSEILDLFEVFGWEVSLHKANEHIESWKVTNQQGDRALLFLGTDGFTMGSVKAGQELGGEFQGYEDREAFINLLVTNGIEPDVE
jgi:hypothetical protein